jgi:hypothetical protein
MDKLCSNTECDGQKTIFHFFVLLFDGSTSFVGGEWIWTSFVGGEWRWTNLVEDEQTWEGGSENWTGDLWTPNLRPNLLSYGGSNRYVLSIFVLVLWHNKQSLLEQAKFADAWTKFGLVFCGRAKFVHFCLGAYK